MQLKIVYFCECNERVCVVADSGAEYRVNTKQWPGDEVYS